MSAKPLLYAKAGGPPDNWMDLRVIDLDTGQDVQDALEVNVTEGWMIRYKRPLEHGPHGPATERVTGRFHLTTVRPEVGRLTLLFRKALLWFVSRSTRDRSTHPEKRR